MTTSAGSEAATNRLADFILLNEEISALVQARLPVEAHLARIGKTLPGRASGLAVRIGQRMEQGEDLATAMDAVCAQLPAAYRATIIAGLEGNRLSAALEALVDAASRFDQLRRISALASIYPLVLVAVACVLFAAVLRLVVPSFDWLNESHYGPVAWLAGSQSAIWIFAVVLPTLAVLAVGLWWWRSSRIDGAASKSFGALRWLPWGRQVRYWSEAAIFSDLLALLIDGGLPLERALRLAGESSGNRRLIIATDELASRVQAGNAAPKLGDGVAIKNLSAFPPLIRLALYHLSNRDLLSVSLKHAARVYRDRAARSAEWVADYLPVALTIGIGGTLTICFTLIVLGPYASMLYELAGWHWR